MIFQTSMHAPIVFLLGVVHPAIDSPWLGTWEHSVRWKHLRGDHDDFEHYNLVVSHGHAGLEARLTADGRMPMIRARLTPVVHAKGVKFHFAESSEPGIPTFSPHELLFEWVRRKGNVITVWHGLVPTNARTAGLYFKKRPTPSSQVQPRVQPGPSRDDPPCALPSAPSGPVPGLRPGGFTVTLNGPPRHDGTPAKELGQRARRIDPWIGP